MSGKRLITFYLTPIFIVCIFSLPLFTPKAHAQFAAVVSDPGHTAINSAEWARQFSKEVIQAAAMNAAKLALQRIVNSSIEWAQTGFEGNPAYVTNPRQYFTNIADGVAGEFIEGTSLGFLCSPFRAQVRLALRQQYIGPERPFQCTLSEIVGNIEGFYGDFSQGGWDAWFSMTQNPQNNPYGAYLEAKLELDSRLAQAVGLADQQLSWNQGFLSWANCTRTNPPAFTEVQDPVFGTIRQTNPGHVPGIPVGGCIERGDTKTPGSVIAAQLNQVLPAGMQSLITAETWEQLIEAFATGILRRYVFGSEGLFATDSPGVGIQTPGSSAPAPGTATRIDFDGDGVYDGLDTTGDGNPDFCYFGGVDTISGPPCIGSTGASGEEDGGGTSPPPDGGTGPAPIVITTAPTSYWSPPQTTNGWWPNLSPDGRYVSYGNWGESWVSDLQTEEVWDFRDPPESSPTEVCRGGWWILPNVLTFTCYGESGGGDRHVRYQVSIGTWTPVRTSDDPALIASNQFVVADGNWASRLGLRLARNGQTLSTSAGGAMSMSGNTLVHACTNDNASICVRENGVVSRTYTPQVPLFETTTRNGYIVYGGFGPVRGINPFGSDVNLRLSNSISEGVQEIVMVSGSPWVLTTGWDNAGNNYIFLRPWGSSSTIAVSANAVHARVVVVGDNFVIAYNNDRGGLAVITVPINSERSTIN